MGECKSSPSPREEGYMKNRIEKREMELADFLQEMIALGWTPESFDLDFDRYQGDETRPEEKETCRKILGYLWEDR